MLCFQHTLTFQQICSGKASYYHPYEQNADSPHMQDIPSNSSGVCYQFQTDKTSIH